MRNKKDTRGLLALRNRVDILSMRLEGIYSIDYETIQDMLRRISSLEKELKPHMRILSTAEVAEYLKVSRSYVYKMVKEGRIPYFRSFRKLRFDRERIDMWLGNNTNI